MGPAALGIPTQSVSRFAPPQGMGDPHAAIIVIAAASAVPVAVFMTLPPSRGSGGPFCSTYRTITGAEPLFASLVAVTTADPDFTALTQAVGPLTTPR